MGTIGTSARRKADAVLRARRLRYDYARRITVAAATAFAWWLRALARRRSRLDLLELSDDQLRDIGVTPREARQEGMRRFWD